MKKIPCLISIVLIFTATYSQIAVQQDYHNQKSVNRLMNRAFGNFVTGQTTSTQIANYASFDPADGSFTFKGVIPIGNENKGQLSYLSVKLGGDLISNSYTVLFNNSSLNTNSFIQAEWNVHLFGETISYLQGDKTNMNLKDQILMNEKAAKLKKIDYDTAVATENLQTLINKDTLLNREKNNKVYQHASIQTKLTAVKITTVSADTLKKYNDSLISNRKAITALEDKIMSTNGKIDSIKFLVTNKLSWRSFLREQVEKEYSSKLSEVEGTVPLTGISFNWFTFSASTGKKKYFRFDDSRSFPQQISKEELSTYRWGAAWNYYNGGFLFKRALYFNIGFARVKDNNTGDLSTQEVVQVRAIKNSAGDTVRTVTKKYNAYFEPITEFKKWNLYTNAYFMFGTKNTGIHFFPEINFFDAGKNITNIGLGYVVSFIDEKKDKPVINAEGYINFLDISNQQAGRAHFWNRNEIGVRFTLPFSLLLK